MKPTESFYRHPNPVTDPHHDEMPVRKEEPRNLSIDRRESAFEKEKSLREEPPLDLPRPQPTPP